MRRRWILLVLFAVLVAFPVYTHLFKASGTLNVSATFYSDSGTGVAYTGDSFHVSLSSASGWTWDSISTHPTSSESSSTCGSANGTCPDAVFTALPDPCGQPNFYAGTAAHGDGVSWSSTYNTWMFDEWDTLTNYTGYALFGAVSGPGVYSESDIQPFNFSAATYVYADFYVWRASSNVAAYPVVAVCQKNNTPDVSVVSGSVDDGGTYSISINGTTYTCDWLRVTTASGTSYVKLQDYVGNDSVYFIVTNTCYTKRALGLWTSYCNDSYGQTVSGFLNSVQIRDGLMYFAAVPSSSSTPVTISTQSASAYYDIASSNSYSLAITYGTVNSDAAPGTYNMDIVACPYAECELTGQGCISDWTTYRQDGLYENGAVSFTVKKKATSVSITPFVSATNDSYGVSSISVNGDGFDNVTVSDSCTGSSKQIPSSDFDCTESSTGTTCTYSTPITFDSPMSGDTQGSNSRSCTITATLYVNGSSVDSTSDTLTVYAPTISSLTVSNTTSDSASWTVTICGAYSKYVVYVDGSQVYSDSVSPSSAGQCGTYSGSVTSTSITPGTHTLTVKAYTSDGGEYASDSASFSANYTYTYSITNFTVNQSRYDTNSSSAAVSGSISGSTTDPNGAYVSISDAGQQVWYATVSSGDYLRDWSANLSCGQHTLTAQITPTSDHSAVKDSKTASVSVYCWSSDIGPSGSVDVPSDGSSVLPNASVNLYYDVSVTPSTDYTVKVYWNSKDITFLFSPGSGHTGVAEVTPADVNMSCGENVALRLVVSSGGKTVATSTSSITLNCVKQYVYFVRPVSGAQYDTYGTSPPSSFKLLLAVDYAGGSTLDFNVDSRPYSPESVACSDYNVSADACYVVPGSALVAGDNNVSVALYNGTSFIASSSVSFTVYAWSFADVTSLVGDTGAITVKEYGSHAKSCTIDFPDLNTSASMLYSSADSAWEYPVDKSRFNGQKYTVECYSPTGKVVFDHAGTVSFAAASAGSGGGSGGFAPAGSQSQSAPTYSVPFWPAVASSGVYSWSVLDKEEFNRVFQSASVSGSMVCVLPRGGVSSVSAYYCPVRVYTIPTTQQSLSELVNSAENAGCSKQSVVSVSGYVCVRMQGSGVYRFSADGYTSDILVAGGAGVPATVWVLAGTAVAVTLAYLYYAGLLRHII